MNASRTPRDRRARLEAALQQIDPALRGFAQRHGIAVSGGTGVLPERNLDWRSGRLKLRLQISVENPTLGSFDIWGMAWAKTPSGQRFRREIVARSLLGITLKSNTHAMLERGRALLEGWTEDDLGQG